MVKNGRGRVEEMGERPGEVASERTGLLEQTTLDEQKHNETWGTTTSSAKKTWAEVVKSGGINVQIVLENGNLGLTTPPTRRGEWRGGAARRLRKKEGEGERGEEKRGRAGPGVSKGKESEDTSGGVERGEESGGVGGPAAV
ncbi:hypothetical protein BZA77DRAFT_359711 [Pyronema omphalodes]|nr:hypothetical protein BZA77DRAFT_359711 [Pyronema omphalodes]